MGYVGMVLFGALVRFSFQLLRSEASFASEGGALLLGEREKPIYGL